MDLHIWIMHHRDYWIMDLHNWIIEIYNWSWKSIVMGILRRNKVFIDIFRNVPFTWRSINNYDYMYLVCVAKKYYDMLWVWIKSRFFSPRPARLGLLYICIVGGQCHTRPLMHVLGCCTPVGETRVSRCVKSTILSSIIGPLYHVRKKMINVHSWRTVSTLSRVSIWCWFPSFVTREISKITPK